MEERREAAAASSRAVKSGALRTIDSSKGTGALYYQMETYFTFGVLPAPNDA
jgi:hypothetical protein